ncbi:MAG: hypothetical protein GTN73_09260 [Candidatus Aminicenantes bacterium]|nr:hypothetical protein [Candidatus Aminicenantes bacterium]
MQTQAVTSNKSSTASKWLIGCGIGCGVVILLLVFAGVGGYFFVKNIVEGFEETEAITDTLTERYGEIKDFCPDPGGAINAERLEVFLSVRNSMESVKEALESSINILSDEEDKSQFREEPSPGVLTKIKTGLEIIPLIAEFYTRRNQALLDGEMGLGEYYFIYVVSYYSWLGKSPADGLEYNLMVEDEEDRSVIRRRRRSENLEERKDDVLRKLHRQILPMMHNQFAKLTGIDISPIRDPWRERLEAEIAAMEADRFRLPWQDGLPDVLEASLEPFRVRFEAGYSKVLNALEMALE